MARAINRLTSVGAKALKEPGLYADGAGLYLRIDQTLARRWVWIFNWRGKRREMGLGPAATVELKDARLAAKAARQVLDAGKDPIADRKRDAQADETFGQIATRVIDEKGKGWKSPITAKQWKASLEHHAPKLLPMDPAAVETTDVLDALKPIWHDKRETATRVRARIEFVLDVARLEGKRSGENPARWKGHLALYLGDQGHAAKHHAALPYEALQGFLVDLRARQATAARALEFVILSATRTSETLLARPDEIKGDTWVIPGERMKGGREHRVPMTDRMLELVEEMRPLWPKSGAYIFPGDQRIEPLSNMAMSRLLDRMKVDVTVHGFRSTFRDWAGDCTPYAREVIEEALAHVVGSAVERAYRRRDALEKRRDLMNAWATFCTTAPNSNVKPFRKPA